MAKRGQKQFKTTVEEALNVALSRNHELTSYTTGRNLDIIPKSFYCVFKCNKCGNIWRTKLGVYLKRTGPAKGCRKCFDQLIPNKEIYANSPCAKKNPSSNQPFRRQSKEILRQNHLNGPHGFIQNFKDLIQFLKTNPNVHNNYVVVLIELGERSFEKKKSSKHHIIPLHDGGSPDKWNILRVSKEEHDQIHRLRYEVYQQDGDKRAIRATSNDVKMISSVQHDSTSLSSFSEYEKEIHNESKKSKYFYRRTPETLKAIEKGMVWKHKDGFEIIIKPNSVETVEQIKELLIDSLPENHISRQKIVKNKTSVNYIREVINNVFGEQPDSKKSSVYGFSLEYYS